jgi:hypothetical protein
VGITPIFQKPEPRTQKPDARAQALDQPRSLRELPAGKEYVFNGKGLSRVTENFHCYVRGAAGKWADRIDWDKLYAAVDAEYVQSGEPDDRLADLKQRAKCEADVLQYLEIAIQ